MTTGPRRETGTKCTFRAVINLECFVKLVGSYTVKTKTLQNRHLHHHLPWEHFLLDCRMTSTLATSHEPVRQQRNLSFRTLIYLVPISVSILPGARSLKRLIYGLSLCNEVLIWNPCWLMAECGLIRHWWDIAFTHPAMLPLPAWFRPKAGQPLYCYALAFLPCFSQLSHFTSSLLKAHCSVWRFGYDCYHFESNHSASLIKHKLYRSR